MDTQIIYHKTIEVKGVSTLNKSINDPKVVVKKVASVLTATIDILKDEIKFNTAKINQLDINIKKMYWH